MIDIENQCRPYMTLYYRIDWTDPVDAQPVGIGFYRNLSAARFFTLAALETLATNEAAAFFGLPSNAKPVGVEGKAVATQRVRIDALADIIKEVHNEIPSGFIINEKDDPRLWSAALNTQGKGRTRAVFYDWPDGVRDVSAPVFMPARPRRVSGATVRHAFRRLASPAR